MSVKVKLTTIYSSILFATLTLFGLASWAFLSFGLYQNLDDSLAADHAIIKSAISLNLGGTLPGLLDELENRIPGAPFIYDANSKELTGNPVIAEEIRPLLADIAPSSQIIRISSSFDGQYRLYIAPLDQNTAPGQLLINTRDAGYIGSTLDQYKNILLASIPFALVIAAGSGFFLANRSLRQVRVITATAEMIDPARLEDRIPIRHNDELGKLSKTLNFLFDRIYGFIDRQNRFTANASHDLTSPLTVIKAETDLALMKERSPKEYRHALTAVSGQVGRMRLIVEDLLALAGLDAGPVPQQSREHDLAGIVRDVIGRWEAPAKAKGISLRQEIVAEPNIYGNNVQLDHMIDNLLSNAVKYTPSGGEVVVILEEAAGNIVITVKDNGIGIAPQHLPHLSERFYRIDRSVEGTGLGLSIVWATAQIYGGRVEVESEAGHGTTFRVFLPVRPKA